MNKLFVIYTTSQFECPWCIRAKELLRIYGFDYYEKDIHKYPEFKEEFLERGFKKIPQVYFEDTLIGGYDAIQWGEIIQPLFPVSWEALTNG